MSINLKEIWKQSSVENYEVSNLGNIRNKKTKKVLHQFVTESKGHKCFIVTLAGKTYISHRLIAEAFIEDNGINPDGTIMQGKHQVNHKDENSLNNNADNLEWCDGFYNSRYGSKIEKCIYNAVNRNPRSKKVLDLITNTEYSTIRDYADAMGYNRRKVNDWFLKNKFPEGYSAKIIEKEVSVDV